MLSGSGAGPGLTPRGEAPAFRSIRSGVAANASAAAVSRAVDPGALEVGSDNAPPPQAAPKEAAATPRRLEVHPGGRDRAAPVTVDMKEGSVPAPQVEPAPAGDEAVSASEIQERLVAVLNETGKRFTADSLERARVTVRALSSGALELSVLAPPDTSLSLKEAELREALGVAGISVQRIQLAFGEVEAAPARAPRKSADEEALSAEVKADPDVERIRELFHGTITRVRSLRT